MLSYHVIGVNGAVIFKNINNNKNTDNKSSNKNLVDIA